MTRSLRSVESEQEIVFTYLDAGFYAFLGSELGAKVSRMLIDQKSETGGVFVERIIVLKNRFTGHQDFAISFTFFFLLTSSPPPLPSKPPFRLPFPPHPSHD